MRSLFGDYRAQMEAEWRQALRALRTGEELGTGGFGTAWFRGLGKKSAGSERRAPRQQGW